MKLFSTLLLVLSISVSLMAQQKADTSRSYEWDNATKQWKVFDEVVSNYDGDKKVSELVRFQKNNQFQNYYFKNYIYDSEGNLVQETERYWDELEQNWADNYRLAYEYNAQGNPLVLTHRNIFNGNLVNGSKEKFLYDEQGRVISKIIQHNTGEWENFIRYNYQFNDDGKITKETILYWNHDRWNAPFNIIYYTYNPDGKLVQKLKKQHVGNEYLDRTVQEYFYNRDNQLKETLLFTFNDQTGMWEKKNRVICEYDSQGELTYRSKQTFNGKSWKNYLRWEFSDPDDSGSPFISTDSEKTFAVTPEPFSRSVKIEFDNPNNELFKVLLRDSKGILLKSSNTSDNEITIASNDLKNGTYFIELHGNSSYQGTFSVE